MELKLTDWQKKLNMAEEKIKKESTALEHTGQQTNWLVKVFTVVIYEN